MQRQGVFDQAAGELAVMAGEFEGGIARDRISRRASRKAATGYRMRTALFVVLCLAQSRSVSADDFAASMASAMARMDRGMMVPPSDDPDRDFAAMMIPHHQGAIDMAEVELRSGHDPVLRRLAQGIIVEQQQEIMVMRQSLTTLPALPDPHAQMHMEHSK